MADPILLIVGLGNPGVRYKTTRHNAGYLFLDAVINDLGATLQRNTRFAALTGVGTVDDHSIRILIPVNYMNESGSSLAKFVRFFNIPLHQTLVVHDDLDLSPGTVRIKMGGGHGGHNGLRDIFAKLGSNEFVRLRIGIGHPGSGNSVTDYVLSPPPPQERQLIDGAIQAAREELPHIVRGEFELAMNALHSKNKGHSNDET